MVVDHDVLHDDRLEHLGAVVDADRCGENRVLHAAAADDAPAADDRIERDAKAAASEFLGEHEFGRRELPLVGADWPVLVVEVEQRVHGDQVHVGFPVGVQRPDVAPVLDRLAVLVAEVVREHAAVADHARDDVFPEIVRGVPFRVREKMVVQDGSPEEVDSHRAEGAGRVARHGRGVGGLLVPAGDPRVAVHGHDAEVRGLRQRVFNRADHHVRLRLLEEAVHFLVVHLVDVVAGQDQDELGLLVLDDEPVLVDRVGRALVPVLADALLGGQGEDVLADFGVEDVPAAPDVAVQGVGFVLDQDDDAAQPGVDAVAEGEVDDPVFAAEGDGGLGAIRRQRVEALAPPA